MPISQKETAMQFELSTRDLDATLLAAALRPLDPDARIALDAARGRLEVISTATAAQVQGALQELGCVASPLEQEVHISGGSTCCGHCA
jgi:copper chaperone